MREQLPEALAAHVSQVVLKGGELIGYADSAAWCERLRYATEGLLAKAHERDVSIARIRVRVSPGSRSAPVKR